MREKDQETQVDIIAEMRMGKPVGPCAYMIGLPDKEEVYESGAKRRITMIKKVTVQELADRLEAAAKREKAQPGNAVAMREALMQCELFLGNVLRHGHPTLNPGDKCTACDGVDELREMVVRALAAPPRNCDKGTPQEQEARWNGYCDDVTRGECPPCRCKSCALYWAQMPYTEEEGAGK